MGSQVVRKSFCGEVTFLRRSGEGLESVTREGNGLGREFNLGTEELSKQRKDQQVRGRMVGNTAGDVVRVEHGGRM